MYYVYVKLKTYGVKNFIKGKRPSKLIRISFISPAVFVRCFIGGKLIWSKSPWRRFRTAIVIGFGLPYGAINTIYYKAHLNICSITMPLKIINTHLYLLH